MERVRVAVWGTGRVGSELVRQGLAHDWLDFRAAIVTNPAKDGIDLGEIAGDRVHLGVPATMDGEAVLRRPDIDLVFYAGLSDSYEAAAITRRILEAGKDCVMLSGLVHPPTAIGAEASRELDTVAKRSGARAVGTGIIPGFLSDVLPVAWLSAVANFERLTVRYAGNIDAWTPAVLRKYAIGLSPADVVDPGSRISMAESVGLIGEAAGLRFDRIERWNEPLLSKVRREAPGIAVEPGTVTGFHRRFAGVVDGVERVIAEWIGVFRLDPAEDGMSEECSVTIEGDRTNWLRMSLDAGMFSDLWPADATRGLAVVPGLRAMPPGLYNAAQLPLVAKGS
jgi:4-hydroxy-tetrahydrodipicolinate reductase